MANLTHMDKEEILAEIKLVMDGTLKAPLTAVYCKANELEILPLENNRYKVKGFVNSQNSYGAMIKTPISTVAYEENGCWNITQPSTINWEEYKQQIILFIVLSVIVSIGSVIMTAFMF